MLVDWFTTTAQIVNFLILVWLLKRFLYKPILRAMDERERRMATALEDAETEKKNAENERLSFEKKSKELAQEKERVLKNAAQEAEEERKRMISVAREEVAGLGARWRDAIDHEKQAFLDELSGRIRNEVFAISRQVFSDLAGANLETYIAERFIERLKLLEPSEKERLPASLGNSSRAVITSAFELSESSRRHIEEALKQNLGFAPEIQFLTAPELIAGIELSTNGRKIGWNIQEYLSSLEKKLEEVTRKREFANAQ